MTEKEILEKAIKEAESNGYSSLDSDYFTEQGLWEMIIFSHDFAKAFWGEEQISINVGSTFPHYTTTIKWQYHLMEMILEEEPLKYLEKFLKEGVK